MKIKSLVILTVLLLLITGCTGSRKEASHSDWDVSWFRMGDKLTVAPLADFELNESNDLLSVSGLYYATWTNGTGREITNADGNSAAVYDAQIYLLLKEGISEENARSDIAEWMKLEAESYETGEEKTVSANGQEFALLPLLSSRSDNPYDHGAAAFGLRGQDTVTVEVMCSKDYSGDPEVVMQSFLESIHY